MKQTQQQKILKLLKEAKANGVNSHDLTYVHGIKQAPTRISELKEQGYQIVSTPDYSRKSPSVNYVLKNEIKDKPQGHYKFVGNTAYWVEEKPVEYKQSNFL